VVTVERYPPSHPKAGQYIKDTNKVIDATTATWKPESKLAVETAENGKVQVDLYKKALPNGKGHVTIAMLSNYHSKQTIHNAVETLWALTLLKHHKILPQVAELEVHAVVYSMSQLVRFSNIVAPASVQRRHWARLHSDPQILNAPDVKLVKNLHTGKMEKLPLHAQSQATEILTKQGYMTLPGQPNLDKLFKERTSEYLGKTVADSKAYASAYENTMRAFRHLELAYAIGSDSKDAGEARIYKQFGAGFTYHDVLALLKSGKLRDGKSFSFDMSGERVNGQS